ncbi:MAG: hypothetical protein E6657_15525, partial [Acinetobacter sp.]|nr:hypothetical protein [Acinetobacter sp.]
ITVMNSSNDTVYNDIVIGSSILLPLRLLSYVDLNHFKIMYSCSVYAFYYSEHSVFFRQNYVENISINMTCDTKKY